jgi:hypothetical protein
MTKIVSNFYFNLNVIKQISQKLKPRGKKQRQKNIRQIFK